eukprot:TRINITY_DN38031_c0_g1_i1.p1 TRINITY_DN38031_c0_g1~~TRINITY_DN38031_c0_g1_i1.p1  ORF type:complete len:271 (-),score=30.55 TRINITY_DN38031_c0_g1_i1:35-796(-)
MPSLVCRPTMPSIERERWESLKDSLQVESDIKLPVADVEVRRCRWDRFGVGGILVRLPVDCQSLLIEFLFASDNRRQLFDIVHLGFFCSLEPCLTRCSAFPAWLDVTWIICKFTINGRPELMKYLGQRGWASSLVALTGVLARQDARIADLDIHDCELVFMNVLLACRRLREVGRAMKREYNLSANPLINRNSVESYKASWLELIARLKERVEETSKERKRARLAVLRLKQRLRAQLRRMRVLRTYTFFHPAL